MDPTTLGLWASIGIQKGRPFAPDARMKAILTEAAAVGDATARALAYRMRDRQGYIYDNANWRYAFFGGYTFEWQPGRGADQYQVQVYADPLLANLVTASPIVTWTGETLMSYTFTDFTFSGNTTYYWVVGSRALGEAFPRCQVGTRAVQWILSDKESFVTVNMPPPGPNSVGPQRPSDVRGWWGERRLPW